MQSGCGWWHQDRRQRPQRHHTGVEYRVVSTAASTNGIFVVVRNGIAPGADILVVRWVNFVRPIASLKHIYPTSEFREGGFREMAVGTTVQRIDLFHEGLH
jgi:hypothetical protein